MGGDGLRAWEAQHARLVVDSVNAVRNARGMTIRDLATALEGLGWPVGLSTLNGILSARKRQTFTVAEVLAFARAIDVSPLTLLLGIPVTDRLPEGSVLPDDARSSVAALRWAIGQTPDGQRRDDPAATLAAYSEALSLVMRRNEDLLAAIGAAGESADGEHWLLKRGLRYVWSEVLELRGRSGVRFPALPDPLAAFEDVPPDELPVPVAGFADEARVSAEVRRLRSIGSS